MTLPDDVLAFLRDLCEGKSIDELRAEVDTWGQSPDLNEAWLAGIRLRAAELLAAHDA